LDKNTWGTDTIWKANANRKRGETKTIIRVNFGIKSKGPLACYIKFMIWFDLKRNDRKPITFGSEFVFLSSNNFKWKLLFQGFLGLVFVFFLHFRQRKLSWSGSVNIRNVGVVVGSGMTKECDCHLASIRHMWVSKFNLRNGKQKF
jgi:hypothetical protein